MWGALLAASMAAWLHQLTALTFAQGIVSLGMLAIPVLAGSTSYALSEARGKREGLDLKATALDYLVDVDHSDHEAIIAVDPSSGEVLGVARYVRATFARRTVPRLPRSRSQSLDVSRAAGGRAPVHRARPK